MTKYIDNSITVCVISYNSGSYILETLESIKRQKGSGLKLIVSDDGSKDDTVSKVENWLAENSELFSEWELLVSNSNYGISYNINRALGIVNTRWVKIIAGDDILNDNCIEVYQKYISLFPNEKVFSASVERFPSVNNIKVDNKVDRLKNYFNSADISAEDQHTILRYFNFVDAPSVLLQTSVFDVVGIFDQRISTIEDLPMWLKLTKSGIKIRFIDEKLVRYRITEGSLTGIGNGRIFSNMYKHEYVIFKFYLENINLFSDCIYKYSYLLKNNMDRYNLNNKRYELVYKLLNLPYTLFMRLNRLFLTYRMSTKYENITHR